MPPRQDRQRSAGRHRQGHGRLPAELRRQGKRADGPADPHPEPADQRLVRHRGRHGDQHPAAQPDGSHQRRAARAAQPGLHDRRTDRDHPGAGLPDRRHHLRRLGRARRLPHRPRPRGHARQDPLRRVRQGRRPHRDHRRRAAVPGQQEVAARAHRRERARQEARRHFRHPRRVRQVGHARGHRTEARRSAGSGAEQPVQADPAAGHLRHEHGGAGQRPAEAAEPQADAVRASCRTAAKWSRAAPCSTCARRANAATCWKAWRSRWPTSTTSSPSSRPRRRRRSRRPN